MTAAAAGTVRGRILRSTAREVASFVALTAVLAMAVAELGPTDRSMADWLASVVPWAILAGIRGGYDRRRAGLPTMLVRGVATALGTAACLGIAILLGIMAGPWIREQAWLPPVLIGLIVIAVLAGVMREFLRESTTAGRAIVLAEILAIGLVPLGLWLATTTLESLVMSVGGTVALSGPVIVYGLQRERGKRIGQAEAPA